MASTTATPRPAFVRHLPGYLFLIPYALLFASFVVLPFIVSAVLAFGQYDLTAQSGYHFVGLKNFSEALREDPAFPRAVYVTCKYVLFMIPLQLILSVLLALGLHALTAGQHTVRMLLFLPGMFGIAVTGVLWQWFYNSEFGLFNHLLGSVGLPRVRWLADGNLAMLSIVVMTLWSTLGGSAVIILTGLQQIPTAIFEAARIDGASAWREFWSITLPMLKPVLIFMVIMNTIAAFQMFGQAVLLTGGGPEMQTRGVVQLIYDTAFGTYRLGYAAAISWLLFLLIGGFSLVQSLLVRRYGK